MNGSAESIIAKVAGMSIRISAGVGVAGGEVWRLPDLARLLDPAARPCQIAGSASDKNTCILGGICSFLETAC